MNLNPYFRSPFTDLTGALISHQWYGKCAKMEMKVIDCMEAYGVEKGLEKCAGILEDLRECSTRTKQLSRALAMRNERHRQCRAGERSKEDRYAPPPTHDSW